MAREEYLDFALYFDEEALAWDPLADYDEVDEDASGGQQGPHGDPQDQVRYEAPADNRSAEQRVEDLFAQFATRRRVMLGLLAAAREPVRTDALQRRVEELQAHDVSVYTGYDFSTLLEEAGALQRVAADGSPFDAEAEQAPDIVEVDGVRFYRPTDGRQVFWLLTAAGRGYLEADDPAGRVAALLTREPQYGPIYERVLTRCTAEGGCATPALEALVDDDPLVQSPRRFCSYFTKALEDAGALEWVGTWRTTAAGRDGLATLRGSEEER